MNLSFSEIIIAHLKDIHPTELRKISAAISGLLSGPDALLKEAKLIKETQSTLHAVKFLRDAGSANTLAEDLKMVKSL